MSRTWNDEEKQELLNLYYSRPFNGTITDVANSYVSLHPTRTMNGVRIELGVLLQTEGVMPSRHPNWNEAPTITGNALIIGDLHIPYHSAEFIERCLALSKKWSINECILGGDALDAKAFSHFPDDFSRENRKIMSEAKETELLEFANTLPPKYAEKLRDKVTNSEHPEGDISEEFTEARAVLKSFTKSFNKILWVMGNHEAWVVKQLQKTISAKDLSTLVVGDSPKWEVSPQYWCNLISGGKEYQIEHPKISGKGSSKKLSAKYHKNIIMLHNHQLSMQADISGEYLSIETGCGADVAKIRYANQRHDGADEHITGAVIVRDGHVWLLNKFTDWKYLLKG